MCCAPTIPQRDENLYYELKNKRPVLYNGYSMGGGHAFVCDGCDSNGFYHINWGWGGGHDGYYKIALLNPNGGGTGSSGTDDGYTIDQGALFGVQKPPGEKYDSRILTAAMILITCALKPKILYPSSTRSSPMMSMK